MQNSHELVYHTVKIEVSVTSYQIRSPDRWVEMGLAMVMGISRWFIRSLMLSQPSWRRVQWLSLSADPLSGKYHFEHYMERPWYVSPTFAR